jgi:limonene 1,2-monooxygenase
MIGMDPREQRAALEEDFDVLMHLLLKDEPISVETKQYKLVEARSQYRPFSDPIFDIGVAAIASPSGPRLAGKHGVGLLSVGATIQESFDLLHLLWDVMEERAAEFGTSADRSKWRLVGPMHLAESTEQAIRDVQHGLDAFCDYTQHTIAAPHFRAAGATFEERIAWVNDNWSRRHRHTGRSDRTHPALAATVGRIRLLSDDGPRMGRPTGDETQL